MKDNNRDKTSLIVFVKNPKLGHVKTRLAADVGDEKALEIYIRLMNHTERVLSSVERVNRHVYYSQNINEYDRWTEDRYSKGLQVDGDLGDRIEAAFTEVLAASENAIIVGSDCAQLSKEIIAGAIASLDNNDVVIGPTYDGGYYLLGMNYNYQFLFEGIEWSTASVFAATLEKVKAMNLKVEILETLSDIDYMEDWEKYGLDS